MYLYREDRDAQIRSWRRAEKTGLWTIGHSKTTVSRKRAPIEQLVNAAEQMFRPRAHIVTSYEEMTANWDDTIKKILAAAGWPIQKLGKATKRMPKG